MSVGPRVVCYHAGLLIVDVLMYAVVFGKADMLVFIDLFNCPVECGAQTVGGIESMLGKTNACCATLGVGSVDSHTFHVAFVGFGQAGSFVLCEGNAVVEEQFVTIVEASERLLDVSSLGCLALSAAFSWILG